jgi:hypothetical protein
MSETPRCPDCGAEPGTFDTCGNPSRCTYRLRDPQPPTPQEPEESNVVRSAVAEFKTGKGTILDNVIRLARHEGYLAGRRDERERAAGIVQERALDQERRAMKADRDEVLGLDMYHRDRAGMLRDVESAIRQEPGE